MKRLLGKNYFISTNCKMPKNTQLPGTDPKRYYRGYCAINAVSGRGIDKDQASFLNFPAFLLLILYLYVNPL